MILLLDSEYAQQVTKQLQELERVFGAQVIENLTDNLLNVTLQCRDKAKRVHKVNLVMNPETFPQSAPECSSDLPMKWQPSWQSVGATNNEEPRPRKKFKEDSSRKEADKVNDKDVQDYSHLSRLYSDFVKHVDTISSSLERTRRLGCQHLDLGALYIFLQVEQF